MEACFCTLTNITEEDIYDSGMYEDKGELWFSSLDISV